MSKSDKIDKPFLVNECVRIIVLTTFVCAFINLFFSPVCLAKQQKLTEKFGPFRSAVRWNDSLLLDYHCAFKYKSEKLLLAPIEFDDSNLILASASDPYSDAIASIYEKLHSQLIEVKAKYGRTLVAVPKELEFSSNNNFRYPIQWLFFRDGRIYLFRREGFTFTYGIYDKDHWDIKTVAPDKSLPSWFWRNSHRNVYLSKTGFYCVVRSSEWGLGVLYYDFTEKKWSEIFGTKINCFQPFEVGENIVQNTLWIVTAKEIRKVIDGKTVLYKHVDDLKDAYLNDLEMVITDLANNLYLIDCYGGIFKLTDDSIVRLARYKNYDYSIPKEQEGFDPPYKPNYVWILYVDSEYILLGRQDKGLVVLDRESGKFVDTVEESEPQLKL
jgi:hypothetical protein